MSLDDVQHQPRARRLIRFALAARRMPHAYIFHGPEGVGRELFAQRLGRVLLCSDPVTSDEGIVDACGRCESCELAIRASHPDIHIIHRELIKLHPESDIRKRKGLELGIDVIRHFVIHDVANKPSMGRAKVFIIREAEKLNVEAQNALLKTLEEPPPTTFLILVTASLESLLPTVQSRCQVIPFGLLPREFVVEQMLAKNEGVTREAAERCAVHGGGSLGAAMRHLADGLIEYESLADGVLNDAAGGDVPGAAKRIIDGGKKLGEHYQKRDPEISDTEAQRRGLKAVFSLMAMNVRSALGASVGVPDGGTAATVVVDRARPRDCIRAVHAIASAERSLDQNVNVQLCVESLLIELSRSLGGCG